MDRKDTAKFLLGIGSLILGIEAVLFWVTPSNIGGIGLLLLAFYLISVSDEDLKNKVKNKFPFRPGNLVRFPRLPYFQTGIMVLLFILTLFTVPSGGGIILVLLILAVTQSYLISSKENIQDDSKIKNVFQIQLFVYFSTFIYANFQNSYLLDFHTEFLAPLFLIIAWVLESFYLRARILK